MSLQDQNYSVYKQIQLHYCISGAILFKSVQFIWINTDVMESQIWPLAHKQAIKLSNQLSAKKNVKAKIFVLDMSMDLVETGWAHLATEQCCIGLQKTTNQNKQTKPQPS